MPCTKPSNAEHENDVNTASVIAVVILGGLSLGWILHHRSLRHLTPILKRLAAEVGGVVQSQNPFVMPKLLFSYSGTDVEVSSASTGIAGESIRYTYVLFKGLAPRQFEFRIRPRSLQTVADEWAGFKKPMATEVGKLKTRLAIYTSDDRLMEAVLSEHVQADLLFWAHGKRENRVSDIRNYDDNLIYAVTGTLDSSEDFKVLLDSACRFFDVVKNLGSRSSEPSNSI